MFGLLGALGYVGMNAAAYVATGHAQANGEAKGKAPLNPFLKFVLGCIFWPAMLLRKVLPIKGTADWRARFRKKVKKAKNKFETRDCEPTRGRGRGGEMTPERKADVDSLIKAGKYKEAFMALNPNLNAEQAEMMGDQFAKYVKRYRVDPASITVEKLNDLANSKDKKVQFSSKSSYNNVAPEMTGSGLLERASEELKLADINRARILELRKVVSDNRTLSRKVKDKLNKMLDEAQSLYINKHSLDFEQFYKDFRDLANVDHLQIDNPGFEAVKGLIRQNETFKDKYNGELYQTMDAVAERTAGKEPEKLDDKEKLLIALNGKYGKKVANEYYEDFQNSVTRGDKNLANQAIGEFEADHTKTVVDVLDSLTKLVLLNQYREATKGKSPDQAKEIAARMGITEDMLKDDLYNNQDIYDHVNANELDILVKLELARKHGDADVAALEAERDRLFSEKFAAIEAKMAEDFEGKTEIAEMLKNIKDIDKDVEPVQLLLELTQLDIVIDQARSRTRDIDLSKEKEQAIAQLQEKYNLIAPTLKEDERPVAEAEMQAFYDAISAATTKEEISAVVVKAEKYLDKLALTLEEYKNKAMEDLNKYAALDTLEPEIAEKVKPVLEAGLEAIRNCDTKEKVDIELEQAKAAIDREKIRTAEPELSDEERENAYNDVKNALEAVKGELTPEALAASTTLLANAKAALFNKDIKTKEVLESEKNVWIDKVNNLEKKKPVDLEPLKAAAIRELGEFYARVRGTLDVRDITPADEKVASYKTAISNATSEEEINRLLAEGKEYLMNLNQTLDQFKEDLKQQLKAYAAVDSIADESKKLEVIGLLNDGFADIKMAITKADAQAAFENAKKEIDAAKNRSKEDELTKEYRDAAYREIVAAYEAIAPTLSDQGRDIGTQLLATAEKGIYSTLVNKKEDIDSMKYDYIAKINALEKKIDVEEDTLTQEARDAAYNEIAQAVEAVRKELSDKGVADADALLAEARTTLNDSAITTKEELSMVKDGYLADVAKLEMMRDVAIDQLARDAAYAEVSLAIDEVRKELSDEGFKQAQELLKNAEKAIYSPFIKTKTELAEVKNEYIARVANLDKMKEPELTQADRDAALAEVNNAINAIRAELSTKGNIDADNLLVDARNAINSQFITTKQQLEEVKNDYVARVANLDKMKDVELTQEERDAAFAEVRDAISAARKELSDKGHNDADAILINAKNAMNSNFVTSRDQLAEIKADYLGRVASLDRRVEPELTQGERDAAYQEVANAVEKVIADLSRQGFKDAEQLLTDAKSAINSQFITTKEQLADVKGQYIGRIAGLEVKPDLTADRAAAIAEVEAKIAAVNDSLTTPAKEAAKNLLEDARNALESQFIETKEQFAEVKADYLGRVDGLEKKPDLTKERFEAYEDVKQAIRDGYKARGYVFAEGEIAPDTATFLKNAKAAIDSEFIESKAQLDEVRNDYVQRANQLMTNLPNLNDEKAKAKEEIEKAIAKVENELLSTEKSKIAGIKSTAFAQIDLANNIKDVKIAKENGLEEIDALEKKPDLTADRAAAIQILEEKVNAMKSDLSTQGLADAERLLADARNALGSQFIETRDQLEAVKNDYLVRADGLERKPDLTADKAAAIQEVNRAIVDASPELTRKALSAVQGIQGKAEGIINAAETLEAIHTARDAAIQEIASLERKPSQQVKDTYRAQVENEYNNYKAQIEQLEQRTGNNFGGKKSVMTKALNGCKDAINAAESVDELKKAVDKAVETFKTQLTKAQNEQFVTITAELDGHTTTLVARNKGGVTKVTMPGYKDFTISPALKDLSSEAAKQEIKRQAEMHRQKVHENTRGVEGEIKP